MADVQETESVETEGTRAADACGLCDGSGKIKEGHVKCPECAGTGNAKESKKRARTRSLAERRKALHVGPATRSFTRPLVATRSQPGESRGALDATATGTEVTLTGHVIIWDTPYEVFDAWGSFTETIHVNAAENLDADVRFMYDHDSLVLARTVSGTLLLANDDIGLAIAANVDTRQSFTNDLVIAIDRRDVTQMSVGFLCLADVWSPDGMNRDVYAIELVDVSAVGIPASPTTDIQVNAARLLSEARSKLAKRIGAVVSAANVATLQEGQQALEALHDVDDGALEQIKALIAEVDAAVDEAQQALADVLGQANPDDDDPDDEDDSDDVDGAVEKDAQERQLQLLALKRSRLALAV